MKDERITKELNKAKLIIFYYIFITTIIFVLLKYFIMNTQDLTSYTLEIFIIFITTILLAIRFFVYQQGSDERIEQNYQKIGNILFSIMFFGSFFIHFLTIAYHQSQSIIMYNFTSTMFMIGVIVLVYQLRKRKIYFHHAFIDKNMKAYLLINFKRILFFSLIFSLNILAYLIFNVDILTGAITIIVSIIALTIPYFIFAIYEKNHYDEEEMLSEGQTRNLSKNVPLLYSFVLLFRLASLVINFIYQRYVMEFSFNTEEFYSIHIIQRTFSLFEIDIILLSAIIFFIIRKSIKRFLGIGIVYKLLTIYIYSSIITGLIGYLYRLLNPLIIQYVAMKFGTDHLAQVSNIFGIVNAVFIIYLFIIVILITYQLYQKRISYIIYLTLYVVLPPIAILLAMMSRINRSRFLLIVSMIFHMVAYISLFIFFYKHTQIVKNIDVEPDYVQLK